MQFFKTYHQLQLHLIRDLGKPPQTQLQVAPKGTTKLSKIACYINMIRFFVLLQIMLFLPPSHQFLISQIKMDN